jgi:hypothetical protein
MFAPLFAADWETLFKVGGAIVVGLYYLISAFAKKVEQKPQPRRMQPVNGPQKEAPKQADPLQAEIDEFLRKAQAQREGRRDDFEPPKPQPSLEPPRRPRPKRRPVSSSSRRESPKRQPPQQPVTPVLVEVVPPERTRESLAEQLAHRSEGSVFDQRARQLSHVQQASDNEFQQHMQKVFDHDVGKLGSPALGLFEAAGAAAAAAATEAASATAGSAQSSAAPATVRKRTSDIALFLAGKKNIRDAVILTEILRRPEERW